MKKLWVLTLVSLLLTTNAVETSRAANSIASCTTIATNPTITKGTSLKCLDGESSIIIESIKGPAVLNVWGSWCSPCRQEMPHFVALAKTGKVKIIGIDVEEVNLQAGQKFVKKFGMNWPNLYDQDGRTKSSFGMGVPVTWFIDANSKLVHRQIGIINSDKALFDQVRKYLGIKL